MFSKRVRLSIAGQLLKLSWLGGALIGLLGFSTDQATLDVKIGFIAIVSLWWFMIQLVAHMLLATVGDDAEDENKD